MNSQNVLQMIPFFNIVIIIVWVEQQKFDLIQMTVENLTVVEKWTHL